MSEAYKRVKLNDLKKIYLEREVFLSVSQPTTNFEELKAEVEAKVEAKAEEQNKVLQKLVNGLTKENMDMRARVQSMEPKVKELTTELEKMKSHQDTVDKVMEIFDLVDIEDWKYVGDMILDYRKKKFKQMESEEIQP